MPRGPTQQQLFDELLSRYGLEIAQAFLKAVDELRSAAELQRVIAAIEIGNIEGAIAALHLDAAAYDGLLEAVRGAYVAGGEAGASILPRRTPAGATLVIRFHVRNPRAEDWLTRHSSALVTNIVEDQKAAVRQALTAGLAKGANPTTTALGVVGRIDRSTGKRAGGILGLTAQQEQFARTAEDELRSGDPAQLRHYLTRARRDKRFDRSVRAAIDAEQPLPAEIAGKAATQYRNRLLKLRGDMIGRTESLTALRAAKHEAFLQAVETGAIQESAIRRTWRSAGDLRVRHTHVRLNGDTAGLREPFRSPSGALLMYPGDTSLGAPASEIVGCRCDVNYRVDFLSNLI